MPSFLHEEIVELFRSSPDLAVDLVAEVKTLPAYDHIDVKPGDLVELVPASLRADVLLLLVAGTPVFAIIVEVQLARDPGKLFAWPFYVAASRARYRCPTLLLVFAVDEDVAAWCAQPIDLGQPNSPFRALVRGAWAVPKVTDAAEAVAHPFRAVLSSIAHGHDDDAEAVGRAAMAGVADMPEDERTVWQTAILAALNHAARIALEASMDVSKFPPENTWVYKKGEKVGTARGKAESVLLVLAARNLPIPDEARQQILTTTDLLRLDEWLRRAMTAASVDELLASTT